MAMGVGGGSQEVVVVQTSEPSETTTSGSMLEPRPQRPPLLPAPREFGQPPPLDSHPPPEVSTSGSTMLAGNSCSQALREKSRRWPAAEGAGGGAAGAGRSSVVGLLAPRSLVAPRAHGPCILPALLPLPLDVDDRPDGRKHAGAQAGLDNMGAAQDEAAKHVKVGRDFVRWRTKKKFEEFEEFVIIHRNSMTFADFR